MSTAITRTATERGRTFKTAGLESTEVTGMLAARTNISGGFATLDISIVSLGPSFILAVGSGMAAVTGKDSGVAAVS